MISRILRSSRLPSNALARQEAGPDELLGDRRAAAGPAARACRPSPRRSRRSRSRGSIQKSLSSIAVVASRISGGSSSNVTTSRLNSPSLASSILPVRSVTIVCWSKREVAQGVLAGRAGPGCSSCRRRRPPTSPPGRPAAKTAKRMIGIAMTDSPDGGRAARPSASDAAPMALPPREAGLHVGPHDSIGVVVAPSCPDGRDGSAERGCDAVRRRRRPSGAPTGSAGLLDELRLAGDAPRRRRPGSPARLATGRADRRLQRLRPVAARRSTSATSSRSSGSLQLQRHGGRPVALVGGGTGMIGDPSGTSAERNLLDRETLAANVAAIRAQLERFLDFAVGRERGALLVNNLDWLGEIRLIDLLRDVGKHFTIPYMLAKDSVHDAAGPRPVVHRVQLHADPGDRLRAPPPDDGRRAPDGRRRPVGQHHGRPRADPAAGRAGRRRGRSRRRRAGPRPRLQAAAVAVRARSSARPRAGRPSGSTPSGRRRTRSTSTGSTSTTATSARTCGGSRSSGARRSRRSRREMAARPEARAAQRALARDVTERTHGAAAADTREPGRARRCSGGLRAVDPALFAALHEAAGGVDVRPVADSRPGAAALARRRRAVRVERRGPPADRVQGGLTVNGTRVDGGRRAGAGAGRRRAGSSSASGKRKRPDRWSAR